MLPARDPVRRRQPVERPLDVIALELLVSASQALLAGVLLAMAARLGGDARSYGLPVPGLLAILGVAVGVGWLRWLMGGSGAIMASVCLATSILAGALFLLSLQDPTLPRIDPLAGLIAVTCALYGLVAGVFLDGPHRAHWKGGISQPRRGMPQTRATPARFSPPVQRVVDERLRDIHMPRVTLPSPPKVSMPSVRRPGRADGAPAGPAVGDGLAVAAVVVPQTPTSPEAAPPVAAGSSEGPRSSEGPSVAPVAAPDPTDEVAEAPTPEPGHAAEAGEAGEAGGEVAAASAGATPANGAKGVVATGDASGAEAPTELVPADASGAEAPTELVPAGDAPTATTGAGGHAHDATAPSDTAPSDTAPSDTAPADAAPSEVDPEAPTEPVARPAPQWPRPIEPRGHTGAHTSDRDH